MGAEDGEPEISSENWIKVTPGNGPRTNALITSEPNIGRLKPVEIYEHIEPSSDTAIVMYPGGVDLKTDDSTFEIGKKLGNSVFHIKYPDENSFSIRREVAQTLDHTEDRGVKKYNFVTGSWGGIPAVSSIYNILKENGDVEVDSFFAVAAALQPSDLNPRVRGLSSVLLPTRLNNQKFPRQMMARLAKGVKDFEYDDPEVLAKMAQIPAVFLVPPGGRDWAVSAMGSYKKYFPHATIIEYPAYENPSQYIKTLGGHVSGRVEPGIRQLEEAFLRDPHETLSMPEGFKVISASASA